MKENEKIDLYLELAVKLEKPWNMKVTVISVVAGALGTVAEYLEKKKTGRAGDKGQLDHRNAKINLNT